MIQPAVLQYLNLDDILEGIDETIVSDFFESMTNSNFCYGTNQLSLISMKELQDFFAEFKDDWSDHYEPSLLLVLNGKIEELIVSYPLAYINLERKK